MGKSKPSPIAAAPKGNKLIPFGWYEGKSSCLDRLLPLLSECRHDFDLAFSAEGIIYRFDLKLPALRLYLIRKIQV